MADAARRAQIEKLREHGKCCCLEFWPDHHPECPRWLLAVADDFTALADENSRLAAELEDAQEALREKRSRAPVWDELDRIAGELNNIHNSELERLRTESARLAARVAELGALLGRLRDAIERGDTYEAEKLIALEGKP